MTVAPAAGSCEHAFSAFHSAALPLPDRQRLVLIHMFPCLTSSHYDYLHSLPDVIVVYLP